MSILSPVSPVLHHKPRKCPKTYVSATLDRGLKMVDQEANPVHMSYGGTKERISKNMFAKVELSVSSYDTAWVAMVPSPNSSQTPCFPECIDWLLNNQLNDGSWGLHQRHPLLVKDALLSTLACVLALKRWDVGAEQMNRGLNFIKSNFDLSANGKQHAPIGFDIIFAGMIEYAKDFDLNLHLGTSALNSLLHKRDLELKRVCGSNLDGANAYLAYVSEGMGKSQDWTMVMKYQRTNGSLFNSPSTTAAALIHVQNSECHSYLRSLLNMFGNAVPTVYPLNIYARLCMVDDLVRLGLNHHFKKEIRNVLEMTYRSWLQGDEEIFSDITTCAMAFRLLRINGYEVSADQITRYSEDNLYFSSLSGQVKDMNAALNLYLASEMCIHPDESGLEEIYAWSRDHLKLELLDESNHTHSFGQSLRKEVEDTLKFPYYANLARLETRRYIENYSIDNTRMLKTSYWFPNISKEDFLKLAVEDYNICQSIHQEEVKDLARWIVDYKLDKLKFARQKLAYCYFSAAATLFSPQLRDARISWAKNSVLATIVDDFFDVGGTEEELINLVYLVEKWDVNDMETECGSDHVQIIFSALRDTICEMGDKAIAWQGRNVTRHFIEIWLELLKSMLTEAQATKNKTVPTMDEYMKNAYVSVGSGPIVLPALYFVGPKLSEEVVQTREFFNLFKLMGTSGRLLNDLQGYKREAKEGKLNAVSLHMIHGVGGVTTENEAVEAMKTTIQSNRRELLRLVLEEKNSVVPRACKNVFWEFGKVMHLFYMKDDGFTSNNLITAVNEVLNEPVVLK